MEVQNRRSIRLHGYDYSQTGYYFVTVCTQNRLHILGKVIHGKMKLSKFGNIVDQKISELKKYPHVDVDEFCIMPNHIHLIIRIVGAGPRACPKSGSTQGSTPTENYPTIGTYIKRFKTLTTQIYIENIKNNNWPRFDKRIWQRNYYEHIIRNENEYITIKQYIQNNPLYWETDEENI